MPSGPLDAFPVWSVFLFSVFLVLLSVECGYRLGRFRRSRAPQEKEAPVGAMAGATLALLAFMLAFTFGLAAQRYDTRRQVLLDEANAIGTTYLRAAMMPERRDEIRDLLREYVDTRLAAVESGGIVQGIRKSEQLHEQLWAHAVALGAAHPTSIVVGLFVQTLNDVIDLHAKRITAGARNRIPGVIWAALFAVAVLSLGTMGYHGGLALTSRSPAVLAVAIAFSGIIWLIADLDRPQEGLVRVSQQPLIDLRQSMTPPKP